MELKKHKFEVIILSGGFGKRLQSVSNGIPKSLMPVGDSLYFDFLLKKVFNNQINQVYLSLHYRSELFEKYVSSSKYKMDISTIVEPKPMGTGGAIKYVLDNSNISSPFIVINGDSLSDINLNNMGENFRKTNYKAIIGISKVNNAERYGTVKIKKGNIISFNEKGYGGSGWINNGYYILRKEIFDDYNGVFSIETDVFPKLTQNHELGAFKVKNDNFIDIGTPDDYNKLCQMHEEVK